MKSEIFKLYDCVKVIDPKSKYYNYCGHVTDALDYSIRVMFREGYAPKNRRGKDQPVGFNPSEIELVHRPYKFKTRASPIDKFTHREGNYRQFWVSVHERPIEPGIKAIAFYSEDRNIRYENLFQDIGKDEVWNTAIKEVDALIERKQLDIPPHQERQVVAATQFVLVPKEVPLISSYKLSVIRRQRSDGIVVFTASMPWQFVAQFFTFEDPSLPPTERAQRSLVPSHAKKIKKYLMETPNYYLPPMIAAVQSEEFLFVPFAEDASNGLLELPMTALFDIIDGQHRTFAIREILQSKVSEKFKFELITVDLIMNANLELRRKLFRETNKLGKPVSNNLTTFYNDSPIAEFANSVLLTIPLFQKFAETEKTSLNDKSEKLLIYKHLYDATVLMKPGMAGESDFKFCQTFWQCLVDVIKPWGEVLDGIRTPSEVKNETVASHGVTIHALGELGKYLGDMARDTSTLSRHEKLLKKLTAIDWDKTNPIWLNRVVDANGAMLSNRRNVKLMLNCLKVSIGVPEHTFSKADKELELTYIGNLSLFK